MDNNIYTKTEQINDNRQKDFLEAEKGKITDAISAIETKLNEKYNEILAEILGKDVSQITEADYIGDKVEFIKYSSDDENVLKKLSSTNEKFEKAKTTVTDHAIDLLQFKAKLYNSNENIIKDLEADIISTKKEKTRLNLAIIEDEQEIDSTENYIKSIEDKLSTVNGILKFIQDRKIDSIRKCAALGIEAEYPGSEEMEQMDPEDRLFFENINTQIAEFTQTLKGYDSLDNLEKDLAANISKNSDLTTRLVDNKLKLGGLDIENKEQLVNNAKQSNLELFKTFETDIADYKKIGIDISPEQLKSSKAEQKKEPQVINNNNKDTIKQSENRQPVKSTTANNQNNLYQNPENVTNNNLSNNTPVPLSYKQIAQNLKSALLGSPNKDIKNMFKNGNLEDFISSIPYFSRTDKKNLSERFERMNETLDAKQFTKLKNIVTALNNSDMCDNLDLTKFIFSNGKVKDFNSIDPKDMLSLNSFISDIDKNKDIIDDEQISFLQDTFINNIRSRVLVDMIKPKSLREYIKSSFSSRNTGKNSDARNIELINKISSITLTPTSKVENIDAFHQSLFGKTISPEDISYPPKASELHTERTL